MKNQPLNTGILAIVSPIPLFFFTVSWGLGWCLGIGMGLLKYDQLPVWIEIVSTLPILISPVIGVLGIIHSLVKRKAKFARLGFLLSVFGVVENGLLLCLLSFLSRF